MNYQSILNRLQILGLCTVSTVAFAYPTIYPTGTTIYNPDEAYSSYILISDHADRGNHPSAAVRARSEIPDDVRLIAMHGDVVHVWTVAPVSTSAAGSCRMATFCMPVRTRRSSSMTGTAKSYGNTRELVRSTI